MLKIRQRKSIIGQLLILLKKSVFSFVTKLVWIQDKSKINPKKSDNKFCLYRKQIAQVYVTVAKLCPISEKIKENCLLYLNVLVKSKNTVKEQNVAKF